MASGARVRSAAQQLQQVRRLVPPALVPVLVERRLEKLWENEDFRRQQEAPMEFLLGMSERASEVPQLARAYTAQMMIRAYMRWHPRAISRQRVQGVEHLTGRDMSRGTILSFTHHHRYEGLFPSLVNAGSPPAKLVITEGLTRPEAGIAMAQHLRVASGGGVFVLAESGTSELARWLTPGGVLAVAPDFPGRTPVTFLGRPVLAPFGTPRLAQMTNSPIVLVTHRRDAQGPYVQVDPPIEPSDFSDPTELLAEVLRRHGEAILDWPEAVDAPFARFGAVEPA